MDTIVGNEQADLSSNLDELVNISPSADTPGKSMNSTIFPLVIGIVGQTGLSNLLMAH